jgi:iron(III) transport system substrate-binding protein
MAVPASMRRSALAASVAAFCALAAAADAQEAVREFTVYDDITGTEEVMAEFKQYYEAKTGEKIDIKLFNQPGEELILTLQLEARAGDVKADAVMLHHSAIKELQDKYGVFEAPLQIGNLSDPALVESVRDPVGDGSAVPALVVPWVINYNTNVVKPEDAPKKWSDLLDERWANKIGFGDPQATNGGVTSLWFISQHLGETKGSPYGWEFYERMAALQPYLASSHGSLMEMVVSGELSVSIGTLWAAALRTSSGDPIAVAQVEEGSPVTIQAIAVTATSEEVDIGRAFAEWIISKEGVESIAKHKGGSLPVRTDVANPPTPFPFDYDATNFVMIDPDWVVDQRTEYLEKFRQALR